jgi:hypothetical protein
VINQYPLRRAIVVSHEILGTDGKFSGSGGAIYDMLKDSPNFFMMLCGHFHGASQRQDTDPGTGKTVFTLLADYQNLEAGGSGYLRVLNFSPSRNRIFVRTYSPYLKKWITSENNQFTLKYNMSENSFQVISSVSGVEPGASVSMEWPNLAEKRLYEWYATVTNPQGTSRGLTWRFTTDSRPIVNGEKYTMQWNSTLKIGAKGLLENDYYRGQGSLLTFVAKGPAHGKVELKPDGSFTYRPEAGYYGTDRFSYWVSSGVLYSRNVNVDITIRAKKENDPS